MASLFALIVRSEDTAGVLSRLSLFLHRKILSNCLGVIITQPDLWSLGRTNITPTNACAYVNGQSLSLQIGATNLAIYYGSAVITNVAHGLTNALEVYANGVYPHYEFLNASNTTTATVQMKMLRCGSLPAFTPP